MRKVKIIKEYYVSRCEKAANNFITENKYMLISTSISQNGSSIVLALVYDDMIKDN